MAAKDSARGKALERWVANRLGWRRRRSGENANGYDDVVQVDGSLAPVSLECKSVSVLQLRTAWLVQAQTNARGRPWAVVQRPRGWREPVVTVEFSFFRSLLEAAGITNQTGETDDQLEERTGRADSAGDEGLDP